MRILVSNDDGVYSPGIECLYENLSKIAEVIVVAPDRDRSAAGKSLTLHSPIRFRTLKNGFISVTGTPTDCVHMALTGYLDKMPDMVVTGINAGANLGDDVLYSGTVAAATEGRSLGLPAIAISLDGDGDGNWDFSSAGLIAKKFVENILNKPIPQDSILNLNIPALPYEKIKGFRVARLGQRHLAENMVKTLDPRGNEVYWIGPPGDEQDAGQGTDFHAVKEGFVSVTPLDMDLTLYSKMEHVGNWLNSW